MKKSNKFFQKAMSTLVISAFLFAPLAVYGQTGKVNFSGTWALNAEKSNFGQQGQGQGQPPQGQPGGQGGGRGFGGGMGNFTAKQEANLLTVERSRPGQDGNTVTTSTKYTLDGKESVNTSGMGESKSVATWSADGNTLTIVTTRTMERNGQSMTTKTTEVWTLTSPTTLQVVSTRASQNGDRVTTMVYDKK